jgi:8-oxo-dGTP pyrophosphatase MutT (NUDIX family)
MSIIAREVELSRGQPAELYHAVEQADYIAVVAITPQEKIPIVRQYRPALEAFAWELPAGLVERAERPIDCCRRELFEETGFSAAAIYPLGEAVPCTGRLSNRIHSFFIQAGRRTPSFKPEPGMQVKLVSPMQLVRLIASGNFLSQLHLGALMLAEVHGFIALPRLASQAKRARHIRNGRKPRANEKRNRLSKHQRNAQPD